MPSSLRVHLLGKFELFVDGRAVDLRSMSRRRSRQLVKLLAVQPGHRMRREDAVDVLWADVRPSVVSTKFRQTLHEARRALEPHLPPRTASSFIRADGGHILLTAPGELWIDLAAFERLGREALTSGESGVEAALALFMGEPLAEEPYDEWASPVRERVRALRRDLLVRLATLREHRGQAARAADALRAAADADPADEAVLRLLMRLLARTGNRREALALCTRALTAVRDQFGVELSPETESLRALLAAGGDAQEPAGQASASGRTPARRAARPKTNLPTPMTAFIGRDEQCAQVVRLLAISRLVTLTGPGGIGKTRIALHVASGLLDRFGGGVWFAPLGDLDDAEQLPGAVAAAFGLPAAGAGKVTAAVEARCRVGPTLLILDTCERLVEACAAFVPRLLEACPQLHVLCTSREVLKVAGEAVLAVPPLGLPPAPGERSGAPPAASEAVQLFVTSAALSVPAYLLGERQLATVAAVCRRLGGLPLAIELAAARLSILSVEQLEQRLSERLNLLDGFSRGVEPRHQTLRAVVAWSYDSLSEIERWVSRRLSVFAGGWTLEAAEAICDDRFSRDAEARGGDCASVLDVLSALADKSLVTMLHGERGPRFLMLDTIRAYAGEWLRESGEHSVAADQHARWCAAAAASCYWVRGGAAYQEWVQRLSPDSDNMRRALEWTFTGGGDRAIGVKIAAYVAGLWIFRESYEEAKRWCETALASGAGAAEDRRLCLFAAARLADFLGDFLTARELFERAIEQCREAGDELGIADAMSRLSNVEHCLANESRAVALLDEALACYRATDDSFGMMYCLTRRGLSAFDDDDFASSVTDLSEVLELAREHGNAIASAEILSFLAKSLLRLGEFARAERALAEAVAICRDLEFHRGAARTNYVVGQLAAARGDHARALSLYSDVMREFVSVGEVWIIPQVLDDATFSLTALGSHAKALRAAAAAAALYERERIPRNPKRMPALEEVIAVCRAALPPEEVERATREGRVRDLAELAAELAGPS